MGESETDQIPLLCFSNSNVVLDIPLIALLSSYIESSSSSSSQLSMRGGEMIFSILKLLPVGVGFHPSDQQLVDPYLRLKIQGMNSELKMKIPGNDSQVDIIPELDVCECEPWDLPAKLNHPVFSVFQTDEGHEPEWFFFSPLHKKNRNGNRLNRATKAGSWKPTGEDRKIKRHATKEVIGSKKTLVFHRGRGSSAVSTGWIIHEYHAATPSLPNNKTYVLCRLTGPPETNFNGIQATPTVNMEVDNPSTGTRILQNVPANIMTSGADLSHCATNIASDIRNYELDDMTPEEHAMIDIPATPPKNVPANIMTSGADPSHCASNIASDIRNYELDDTTPEEHAMRDRSLLSDFGIDSDGYLYEKKRSAVDSGNLGHCYIRRLSTYPQTSLKGAYGKGGGSSHTHAQVAKAEAQICNGKGSLNYPDTASAGHEPSSSPGYLVNSLVGILLLVILIAVMVRDIHAKFSKPWF